MRICGRFDPGSAPAVVRQGHWRGCAVVLSPDPRQRQVDDDRPEVALLLGSGAGWGDRCVTDLARAAATEAGVPLLPKTAEGVRFKRWWRRLAARRCSAAVGADEESGPTPLVHNEVYGGVVTRTNIDIDDDLVGRAMAVYGLGTKRAAVDLALRRLIGESMSREDVLAMAGVGFDLDNDDLEAMSDVDPG